MDDLDAMAAFYSEGFEQRRLLEGVGALEFARTQMLLERFLPAPPAHLLDVGGGPGRYAAWLAGLGYHVALVDPIPLHIEQARAALTGYSADVVSATIGDARALEAVDASADAVLLLGPLYHLLSREDRLSALKEARRVVKPGGHVLASAISRFASTIDGLRRGFLEDPVFASVAEADRLQGQHHNQTRDPNYFTTAYFHRPEELRAECVEAGLLHVATLAVEGPAWLLADLDARLADDRRKAILLNTLSALEAEASTLGVSAHLLMIATRHGMSP